MRRVLKYGVVVAGAIAAAVGVALAAWFLRDEIRATGKCGWAAVQSAALAVRKAAGGFLRVFRH